MLAAERSGRRAECQNSANAMLYDVGRATGRDDATIRRDEASA